MCNAVVDPFGRRHRSKATLLMCLGAFRFQPACSGRRSMVVVRLGLKGTVGSRSQWGRFFAGTVTNTGACSLSVSAATAVTLPLRMSRRKMSYFGRSSLLTTGVPLYTSRLPSGLQECQSSSKPSGVSCCSPVPSGLMEKMLRLPFRLEQYVMRPSFSQLGGPAW